jgi:hypothetical protein
VSFLSFAIILAILYTVFIGKGSHSPNPLNVETKI